MYTGTGIILCIWTLILIIVLGGLILGNIKLFYYLIRRNEVAKKHIQMVKHQTEIQFNRIATMKPDDLEKYLSTLFAKMVQLSYSSDISENDPDLASKLFFKTSERMIAYLGPETIDAIEFYYGENYIFRWCELTYKYLNNTGALSKILRDGIFANPQDSINQTAQ